LKNGTHARGAIEQLRCVRGWMYCSVAHGGSFYAVLQKSE
jgi:hypothetical protein